MNREGGRGLRALHFSIAFLLPAAAGVAWYAWIGGGPTLLPTNLRWAMVGDWSSHHLSWLFFRNEPWALPLGWISGLFYPVGSTLGYTDALPWIGILLKPFSALLPLQFQYLGPWLGLCFAAQGVAGALLLREFTPHPWLQAIGGALFVCSPPLMLRVVHPALCAHALFILLIWLNLRACPEPAAARRNILAAGAALLFASGLHPYMAVMVLALAVALVVRYCLVDRLIGWPRLLGGVAALLLTALGGFYAFGYLGLGVITDADGFGVYASDFLSFVEPQGTSRWFRGFGYRQEQAEGMAYLGAGGGMAYVLAAASMVTHSRRLRELPWARAVPVATICVLMALFSLSRDMALAGKVVVTAHKFYAPFHRITDAFRASGRFIWPLHCFALALPMLLLLKLWSHRPRLAGVALLGCLALEAAELDPSRPRHWFSVSRIEVPSSETWNAAVGRYRHLHLFPTQLQWTDCDYDLWNNTEGILPSLTHLAYRLRLTFNSGYAARYSPVHLERCEESVPAIVDRGELDPETVYIVAPDYRSTFEKHGATCGTIDGHITCVRPASPDPFARALQSSP